ncbi:MAG: hypothetical protein HW421_3295 [Ignavibacteria bacterium]|nr:hypothetical protein [Ignavibacteria bacterium]
MKNYFICIKNDNYEASLEIRKLYQTIEKEELDPKGYLRIIDESGEDYLYPSNYFIEVEIPEILEEKLLELA